MIVGAFPFGSGFPLQSLTWVKGFSLSCAYTLAHGLSVPASAADHSGRLHGRNRTSGRKDKRNTSVRAVTRALAIAETSRAPSRPKEFPVLVRKPEADSPPIYFSRTYVLALGNGRSRLSGRLLFPHPASNRPLTGMTDRAFFP